MIDCHCHILPGLDDGARNIETAIEMARIAADDGVRVIIATPHLDLDENSIPPDVIRERVVELNEALQREGIELTVLPGAEAKLSPDLPGHVEAGRVMTVGDLSRHILLELPFGTYPTFMGELFFQIQLLRITPILAHPERAAITRGYPQIIDGLVDRGALLQINLGSLLGREGRGVQGVARRLIRDDLAYMIGSDAHSPDRRPPGLSAARKALRRLGGDPAFESLTKTNPAKLIAPPKPPAASPPRS